MFIIRIENRKETNYVTVQAFDSNALGDGAVFGCDFVGEVEEVGENVKGKKKGDVVAGLIWGGEYLNSPPRHR